MVRAARLRRSGDIEKVRSAGRSFRRASFNARVLGTQTFEARLAVSAPRSLGTAVLRNRARRRVREAFRQAATLETAPGGADVLVTVRREAAEGDFAALVADAASVLRERGA
ncbi:MAG: ribonuclease P protein component [Chloroflexi bacterium 13_1_40CM_4_68_4]|nr:MAG: ribonuclease P protein component [Chloroflexi bacterium 13_1_40CM_4_68_4]